MARPAGDHQRPEATEIASRHDGRHGLHTQPETPELGVDCDRSDGEESRIRAGWGLPPLGSAG